MKFVKVIARPGFSVIAAMSVLLASLHVEAAPPIQVTAADPSSAPQGTVALDVIVSGSGFDSSAAVDFLVTGTTNPGGVTVKRVNFVGSKKLIVTIDVADTATVAQFDIEVRLSGGRKGKGTTLFAVQAKSAAAINPSFVVDPKQQYKDKIVRLNADGNEVTTISGPLVSSPMPRWSPDGRSILYFDWLSRLLVRMTSRSGAVEATMPTEPQGYGEFDWSNTNVGSCRDLIVYSGSRDIPEYDLFVTDPDFIQNKKLVMGHDLDDASVGNEDDPDMNFPAWSANGGYIAVYSRNTTDSGSIIRKVVLFSVSCSSGVDVNVDREIELVMSFGSADYWWNGFTWNSSGRYLAMTVHDNSDANLWIADLGDPGLSDYPDATPSLYRLTGVSRPFGSGAERVMSAAFAPAADTIAFVTQGSSSDKTDSLYTINAGACIAALVGAGSVSTGCAVTLVSKGINAYNIDWRPNWPAPLP